MKQLVIECSEWLVVLNLSIKEPGVFGSCSAEYNYSILIALLLTVHYGLLH